VYGRGVHGKTADEGYLAEECRIEQLVKDAWKRSA
jgi:hypothetical protein